VSREELIEHVWQGAAVTDDALVQRIVDLRKAFGDDSRHPRFIKTVPKAGYRFIAEVEETRLPDNRPIGRAATFEGEETATFEVEVEEETDEEFVPQLPEGRDERRALLPARRWLYGRLSRTAAVFAGVIALAVLAVLLARSFRPAREVVLPQLPGKGPSQ
jgi:hypothetical protein